MRIDGNDHVFRGFMENFSEKNSRKSYQSSSAAMNRSDIGKFQGRGSTEEAIAPIRSDIREDDGEQTARGQADKSCLKSK